MATVTPRLSKYLLALEALVLAAPLTLLFATIALDMLFQFLTFEPFWQLGLFTSVVIVAALVSGWSLMGTFWRHGAAGLRTGSNTPWVLVLIGTAATLVALLLLATGESSLWPREARRSVWALAWGLPLIVPIGHLFAERLLRPASS